MGAPQLFKGLSYFFPLQARFAFLPLEATSVGPCAMAGREQPCGDTSAHQRGGASKHRGCWPAHVDFRTHVLECKCVLTHLYMCEYMRLCGMYVSLWVYVCIC